ncbi:MAG: cytochrome c1 [Robiginitomaculum sp.]|nr:cytochrome c1 [Robiginitomaculum sp.]
MLKTQKTKMAKTFAAVAIISTSLFAGGISAQAAGGSTEKPAVQEWGFKGPFGTYDRPAMQRGYQVYKESCSSCHALEHLSFRHLGDKGGPFYDANFPNPNDNPVIKAFAKDWEVSDIDQDSGDPIDRPGIPADGFPDIFPNAIAAAASNGGAVPPDLSLIVPARTGGADYVYALLTGYDEVPHDFHLSEGMNYNTYFEGNQLAMARPLFDDAVEYADGTKATTEQMARDVVEFLSWAGDPKMEVRKKVGFATFLFLFIFALLLFMTYKEVWRNVDH